MMWLGEFKKLLSLCGYPQRFSGARILAQSGAPASVTGTTNETVLATIPIPPLGPNSQVWLYTDYTFTNNSNTKTLGARIDDAAAGIYTISAGMTLPMLRKIMNRGSTSSQIITPSSSSGSFTSASGAFPTSAIDLSAATTLTLTATLSNSADTLTLEAYTVEIRNS